MIFDSVENASRYFGMDRQLDAGLKLLSSTDFSCMDAGKHEIEGSQVFYMVQNPALLEMSQTKWEHHEKYIDIQFALTGGEQIAWLPTQDIADWDPMDTQKDIAFARNQQAGTLLNMEKGRFAVFFPTDAHRPCIAAADIRESRKVVVKVPVR